MNSQIKSKQPLLTSSQFSEQLKRAYRLFKKSNCSFYYFFLSIFLSISLVFVNISSVFILFFLIDGIILGDFQKAVGLPGFHSFSQLFPASFSPNSINFLFLILGVYFSTLVKNLLCYGAGLSTALQSQITASSMRLEILERYLIFGRRFYQKYPSSYLQGVISKSSTWVRTHLSVTQVFLTQLLSALAFFIMMIKISWILSLVAVAILPIVNWFASTLGQQIRKRALLHNHQWDDFSHRVDNIISNIKWVQLYGKEEYEKSQFKVSSQEEVASYFKMERLSQLIDPMNELSATTSLVVIASVISLLASQIGLKANQIFLFIYLVNKVVPVFHYANRLRRVLAEGSGVTEQLEWIFNDETKYIPKSVSQPCPSLNEQIEFKHLNFGFEGNSFKLKNICFKLKKGEKIGIIGHTGAGKSTLTSLLLRFYEAPSNSILYDGRDIAHYSITSYRTKFSLVSQNLDLLNGSLRENLNYGLITPASDLQLEEILSELGLISILSRLSHGLDTSIGVRGSKLSAGECQRISLARALLRKPEILILDEPTSHLDTKTESQVMKAVHSYTKNATVLIIAHRLSTLREVDQVLVMSQGGLLNNIRMQEFNNSGFSLESLYNNETLITKHSQNSPNQPNHFSL